MIPGILLHDHGGCPRGGLGSQVARLVRAGLEDTGSVLSTRGSACSSCSSCSSSIGASIARRAVAAVGVFLTGISGVRGARNVTENRAVIQGRVRRARVRAPANKGTSARTACEEHEKGRHKGHEKERTRDAYPDP